jgi:hypothetical protein
MTEWTNEQKAALLRVYQAATSLIVSAVRPPDSPKPTGPKRADPPANVVYAEVFEWFEKTVARMPVSASQEEPDWKYMHLIARHGKVLIDNGQKSCWVGHRDVQLPPFLADAFYAAMAEIEWEEVESNAQPNPTNVIETLNQMDRLPGNGADGDETGLLPRRTAEPTGAGYVDGRAVLRVIQHEAGLGTLEQVPEQENVLGVLGNGIFHFDVKEGQEQ